MSYYELSRQVNDRKVADIGSTKADIVATSCGTCRMHIMDGLQQNNMDKETLHVIQILDRSYQAGSKK